MTLNPDERLQNYVEAHSSPEPEVLVRLDRETHLTQLYPRMLSGHIQGGFLKMLVTMIRPARILEIGTFTGYSAIAMGYGLDHVPATPDREGGDSSFLHTIEINPELEEGIRKYIREAGMEKVIMLHIGDAREIIPFIDETWDLVFIDADKPAYVEYYELVMPRLRPGGFIVADNVLWDGKVTGDPGKMDRETRGIVAFNRHVRDDERVENVILPLRDGLMLIRKR
ncbi:MAG TPA: O-methyltransferase [Bacteroidales bacterium]|nr:O-methyltransferase [Bacteroidales bacterium]HPS61843.1 O-methyltransferase [Bacteroidales bacterium]